MSLLVRRSRAGDPQFCGSCSVVHQQPAPVALAITFGGRPATRTEHVCMSCASTLANTLAHMFAAVAGISVRKALGLTKPRRTK